MRKLSICIVNWNTKDLLAQCLHSIFKNRDDLDIEVLVVDNASTDSSTIMIKTNFPQVKLIENHINLGFAKANNQAIKESSSEYFLLLNPDAVILPQSLKIMFNFMRSDLKIGIVGPKILNSDGTIQLTCARTFPTLLRIFFDITTLSKKFPKSRIFGSYAMSYWNHDNEREVDSISGACMLIKRKMLDEIGPLDENFFMYAEDTDLCYRAKKKNWKIWYLPKAQIIHYGGQSSRLDIQKMTVESHKSMHNFFKKHHGNIYAFFFRILIMTSMLTWNVLWFFFYHLGIEKDKFKLKYILKKNNEILKWAIKNR